MTEENLTERIELRLTAEMYAAVLYDAGGDKKRIAKTIRGKLSSSYFSVEDARHVRAQLHFLMQLVRELVLDNTLTVTRMKSLLADYEGDDLRRERAATEKALAEKIERIERLLREAGL